MRYAFGAITEAPLEPWPWEAHWWKCSHPRRALVKAAALILAEIERYDRKMAKEDALHGNKTPNVQGQGMLRDFIAQHPLHRRVGPHSGEP